MKEIYELYKNMVFNLALQYVHSIEDAEEITQDIFVKIFDKLDSFEYQSDIKTWIYRITINYSLDFIKAKNRKKRSFLFGLISLNDDGKFIEIPTFNHPGILLEQKEGLENLLKCIDLLPENQKTVIFLLKIECLSQVETAEIMQLSTKAVESLFQRAKNKLEKILQNEGK